MLITCRDDYNGDIVQYKVYLENTHVLIAEKRHYGVLPSIELSIERGATGGVRGRLFKYDDKAVRDQYFDTAFWRMMAFASEPGEEMLFADMPG